MSRYKPYPVICRSGGCSPICISGFNPTTTLSLFCGVDNPPILRIIRCNTPAMPLYVAHLGGFFASGVCK